MITKKFLKKLTRITLYSFLILLGLFFAISLHVAPKHKPQQTKELRGVWLTNIGTAFLHHTTQLDEVFHDLSTLNFNTIYPAVWNRGYTLNPNKIAKGNTGHSHDPLLSFPFNDILRSTVKQGHRQGLRIIPWFEYGLMIPASSNLVKRHPDWVTQTITGEKIYKPHSQQSLKKMPPIIADQLAELSGANLVWLNPSHPEVQEFITKLITDVVQKYNIEGIQLDDHFAIPVNYGYDPYTTKLYQQQHSGNNPPNNYKDSEWMRWRSRQLSLLMQKISQSVKAKKPNCIISLSPNPPKFSYREYLQDWVSWLRQGWVDEIVVQIYRDNETQLAGELSSLSWLNQLIPVNVGLYTGPMGSPVSSKKIAQQVTVVRKYGYGGVSFFSWESTLGMFKKDSTGTVKKVFREIFK